MQGENALFCLLYGYLTYHYGADSAFDGTYSAGTLKAIAGEVERLLLEDRAPDGNHSDIAVGAFLFAHGSTRREALR